MPPMIPLQASPAAASTAVIMWLAPTVSSLRYETVSISVSRRTSCRTPIAVPAGPDQFWMNTGKSPAASATAR